jgi:hypothetical protein
LDNGPYWDLKQNCDRYFILIFSVVAMEVKFGVTLREEMDTKGNILVKVGTNNGRLKGTISGAS